MCGELQRDVGGRAAITPRHTSGHRRDPENWRARARRGGEAGYEEQKERCGSAEEAHQTSGWRAG
jgi:hypothetical protein